MPLDVSYEEALLDFVTGQTRQVRKIETAEVISFSRNPHVVSVKPLLLNQAGEARASLSNVPVIFPGARWDIQAGTQGLLLICDEDIKNLWRTDEVRSPATESAHKVQNAVFMPGFSTKQTFLALDANTTVLEKPKIGGEVRLGDSTATKAVVHEDVLLDLFDAAAGFFFFFQAWATALQGATAVDPALVNASAAAMVAANGANAYQSPSVKVED